ncbi:MAG TPA: ABC transporter ATP-binding protein [Candidatus Binatia bacterium]|nr:ABC transporter ATP-binding protein [Candidatus Binatia bacterium]
MAIHPAVALENVTKLYGEGERSVAALSDVSLTVERGEFISVMGQSGSGKSTLLNLVCGLDAPTTGRVSVDGRDLWAIDENARADLRLSHIAIVLQNFNLFPTFTVEENVAWRLEFQGASWRAARKAAGAVLEEVKIPSAARRRLPAELSGGEQQRVAIARALVTGPELLLADEPTGNLDSGTGETILGLLRQLNAERELTILMVTHNAYAATSGQRTIELRDGRVECDVRAPRAPLAKVVPLRD